MGFMTRTPTSNEPDDFDRDGLMLRLGDEEGRNYIKHLEDLVKRAGPIVEAVIDVAQDQESKDMLTDWLRDERAGPGRMRR